MNRQWILDSYPIERSVQRHTEMAGTAQNITYRRNNHQTNAGDLKEEKDTLINKIKELAVFTERPMNVVFIGPPGVGKSSLINSIAAAFSWEAWREYAYSGSHGGEGRDAITTRVNRFPKCCNEDDYRDYNLPQLIDVPGFAMENTTDAKEILRIILFGRLPVGESLKSALNYCREHGWDGLRERYKNYKELLKVDRLVFVASYNEPIPENIISVVIAVARSAEDDGITIPIFGVMTKPDSAAESTTLREREQTFTNALGLSGAKTRFLRCQNYCDAYDDEHGTHRDEKYIPEIDVPILRFMKQVCDSGTGSQNPNATFCQPDPNRDKPKPDERSYYEKTIDVVKELSLVCLVAMVVRYLMPSPFSVNMRSMCLQYRYGHQIGRQTISEVCDSEENHKVVGVLIYFGAFVCYFVIKAVSWCRRGKPL